MHRLLMFTVAAAAAAASASANATVITATFSGPEVSQIGTSFTTGQTVTGSFVYDTATSSFTSFTVGGLSIVAPFSSSALIGPALTDAIYQAQISPLLQGGTINNTFAVDLSSLTTWPSNNAISLLTNNSQLTTNLDTVNNPLSAFPSTFDYYTANSNGTNIKSVTADLVTLNITSVPEPASLTILAGALLGLGFMRRRS